MHTCEQLSDRQLIQLIQEDSHAAFTEIYSRFKGILYVHAYRKVNDRDEAKDIVQDLFTSIWNNRQQLQVQGSVAGYLYSSIRNRVINSINKKKTESTYLASLHEVVEANSSPTDHLVRERQLSQLIEQEIDQLPQKMREIFIMSRKLNMSHREIAAQLDIAELQLRMQEDYFM